MDDNIIICQDASVCFKSFKLETGNLTIPRGYIIGIQGDNGAGKSTLLKMIASNFPKMNGKIILDGEDVIKEKVSVLSKLAFISEDVQFFVEESIAMNEQLLSGFYNNWNHDLFDKWLKEFDLIKTKQVGTLSKGQQVKFQMAFAAAHTPKVMLLDEPTAGLDPVAREDFLKIIQQFVAEFETTILLATHLDEDINRFADFLIHIDNGVCAMVKEGII